MSSVLHPPRGVRRTDLVWAAGLGLLAFAVRLEAVLRGGGLFGRIGYDGSVYYASASALTHGLLPYRDFLLLHPPGIVLALLPFAALGRVLGDADGYALARLAWFGLGATSTVLVFAVLRSRGLATAVLAAASYALFLPAVTSEHTTSLEAVGSLCLLGAVALLTRDRDLRAGPAAPLLLAGALLGVSTGTKIWGVAVVLALTARVARGAGPRRAALVLAGAVGGTVVVCLPFFAAAPGPMWRMVVLDQLGRRREPGGLTDRLVDISGLSGLRGEVSTHVLALVAAVVLAGVLVLALRDPLGRLAALLLATTSAVLLLTPPWSVAYTGLAAPAVALLVGAAAARAVALPRRSRALVGSAMLAGLVAYAALWLPGTTFGTPFPGRSLRPVLAGVSGCVTTDDPVALIETGALQQNLHRGCPTVVDLSGYSYDLRPGATLEVRRTRDAQWQRYARTYLASGDAEVVVRFRTTSGLSRRTRHAVATWPVLARTGPYEVRRPSPRRPAPPR